MRLLLILLLQQADSTPAARALARLLDEAQRFKVEESIDARQRYGLPIEHLPDLSLRATEREAARARELKVRLIQIDTNKLSLEEQLSAAALSWELNATIEGAQYFWNRFGDVTPYSTPLQSVQRVLGAY